MDVDVACVGFGPATAGFLTTLSRKLVNADGTPAVESATMPGMPPQVVCYERADDIGFGVSGVVTKARALRATFPDLNAAQIPMSVPVQEEKIVYLLDPIGASRRSWLVKTADACIRAFKGLLPYQEEALELPWAPEFLHKNGGMILSMGQFMQWVGAQVQSSGLAQIWPGMPVSQAILESDRVVGLRLLDQESTSPGNLPMGFAWHGYPRRSHRYWRRSGGSVGEQLDQHFGRPEAKHVRDWAVGMKFVLDLPADTALKPGTVFHTFGFPSPRFSGSYVTRTTWLRWESLCRRGLTAPSAQATATCSIGFCTRISGVS
jgi:electron-transferring-flavoprotein dehydrogenase